MIKKGFLIITMLSMVVLIFPFHNSAAKEPKGAKAIFDSGEGSSVKMSIGEAAKKESIEKERYKKEKYIGISYQIMLVSADGQFKVVPKSRVFRSGEKIKLLVRTNRPGYMTILNVGPTGNTNVLFNEYVEAYTMYEIPRNTNFKFVGKPGIEKLLIMLSNEPNPIIQPIEAAPTPEKPAEAPVPTAPEIISSIEGAKGIKGAKDIVAEDSMRTSYSVISPKSSWKPIRTGGKDIVLESYGGSNYGVIPVTALADGGILTLDIKLKHR